MQVGRKIGPTCDLKLWRETGGGGKSSDEMVEEVAGRRRHRRSREVIPGIPMDAKGSFDMYEIGNPLFVGKKVHFMYA
ncbi:hypothetical protein [Streptomyces sp. NPDC051577]|uniref:hypothetical protein n=1 Tax=Streptomyces sp. NPDC051577 TaxID=3155166 RepID=UPI003415AF0E